jgi:hypothetical protein
MSVADCEAGMNGSNFSIAESSEIKVNFLVVGVKFVGND